MAWIIRISSDNVSMPLPISRMFLKHVSVWVCGRISAIYWRAMGSIFTGKYVPEIIFESSLIVH